MLAPRPWRRVAASTLVVAVAALAGLATLPPRATALETGVVVGYASTLELPFVRALGARSVRVEMPIGTSAAELRPIFDVYAAAGVRPLLLAGFPGRVATAREAANVATWAAAYGAGGTYWDDRPGEAASALRHIEMGNESSYPSQYRELVADPDWATTLRFRSYATQYARSVRAAAQATRATGRPVGVLAVGDVPGRWATWHDALFAAVPDLDDHIGGWTAHPYGPRWASSLDFLVADTRRKGARAKPIFVTEIGVANDRGRCLDQNFGWSRCSSATSAGRAMSRALTGIQRRYGRRIAGIWVYRSHDLRPSGASRASTDYFGALTASGAAKGGYTRAVKRLLRRR